jgi:precorrin-3B synthase
VSIRGACPSIAAPMQTGDGLLARVLLSDPLAIEEVCALCDAAEAHGNGIVEVTQRGSLQVRGLTESSAPRFSQAVTALGIGKDSRTPLLTSPLFGLDATEPFDSTALVHELRAMLQANRATLARLGPKVSVLIDGGGALSLDCVPADIRLVATSNSLFKLSLGGDAATATLAGYVSANCAPASVQHLLRLIANWGPTARARDLIPGLKLGPTAPAARRASQPIGTHPLKDGTVARGFGLPFGHTMARTLRHFAESAAQHGATAIRPAPDRSLLAIGLTEASANDLSAFAVSQDFIVDADDARRHVVACAGKQACASASLATRQLAPEVARAARSLVGTSHLVHLSGCSKGCAHPGPAAITIVGPDRVILKGRAADKPHARISSAGLVGDIERLCRNFNHD